MTDNTENVNGVEIYVHQLFELADEYIDKEIKGDDKQIEKRFRDMLLYISDRIEVPSHENIEGLDKLFSAYTRLCTRFAKLPTLEGFSFLANVHRDTITSWMNEEYRAKTGSYSATSKNWKNVCKSFVIDELTNSKLPNPNLIFVSKACHGLRETSPIPAEPENKRVLTATELPKLGSMNRSSEEMILPDLTE